MQFLYVSTKKRTATPEIYELLVVAQTESGGYITLPYGWRRGDPHGFGPQIDKWMDEHPDFPVEEPNPSA